MSDGIFIIYTLLETVFIADGRFEQQVALVKRTRGMQRCAHCAAIYWDTEFTTCPACNQAMVCAYEISLGRKN